MRIVSTISLLAVAILLFFAASNVALAKEGGSLIDQLSEIDVFHPPSMNDPKIPLYNEWHYFNVIDEEQNLSFVTTLKLNGDIYNESNFLPDPFNSSAIILIDYHTPDGTNTTIEGITEVEYSSETPDLKMDNSTVKLTKNGYYVHVESSDGQTVFDALFKPDTELVPLFSVDYFSVEYDPNRVINWLAASPKMKVTGTLTINKTTQWEKTYTLKNVRGYHDHNWGYWAWSDDIGWNWGQASETKNHLNGNDIGKYTFSFGDITNNNHTKSKGAVLHIWKNKKLIADFKGDEINISHHTMMPILPPLKPFPLNAELNATSNEGTINILFTTDYATPIPIPIGIYEYLVIWEITGTYDVNGVINGKPVSYTTKGFLEYVA